MILIPMPPRSLFLASLPLVSVLLGGTAFGAQPGVPGYDRLYVFGDSYSDSGAGYIDGDGPTAVVYLARHLGLNLVPAPSRENPQSSLNFAVSGARTDRGAGHRIEGALLGYGMRNQIEDFEAGVRAHRIEFNPGRALFFIAGGLNDSRLATTTTIENLKEEIRILHSVGARRFMLALLPMSLPNFSQVGRRLNPDLARIPQEIRTEFPDVQIALSSWGLFMDYVMRDAVDYGIENTTSACAGRAIFHEDATPCQQPSTYFYYHAGHPSTAVHRIVGGQLYEELLSAGPKPE
ncbi:SGNH/GDSL hydrolase family protein [Paludibaculum fermentans]|uniref:GDSL family lipase n=1 Tax=Paludibaculum fermentans TaxID=1473598 RepID=A0A7S7NK50_PALFE|nr:SGNH/GDSL hydrolase family protein [Paludibaculum fermentans]QOY85082.1 GDSL family lipase [Paludibaculum fermentans]